jgi:hypothetical protein
MTGPVLQIDSLVLEAWLPTVRAAFTVTAEKTARNARPGALATRRPRPTISLIARTRLLRQPATAGEKQVEAQLMVSYLAQ